MEETGNKTSCGRCGEQKPIERVIKLINPRTGEVEEKSLCEECYEEYLNFVASSLLP